MPNIRSLIGRTSNTTTGSTRPIRAPSIHNAVLARLWGWTGWQARALIAACETSAPVVMVGLFAILVLLWARHLSFAQNGDGLLATVMSLQKITLYYWAEDRFANLLPALTMWIQNPVDNVYAQVTLRLVLGLIAPLFFCSLIFRRAADSWRATLTTDLLLLLGLQPALAYEMYLAENPYCTALACAGLSTLALRSAWHDATNWRWAFYMAGLACLLAAYLTDFGLVPIAMPLITLLAILMRSLFLYRLLVLHVLAAAFSFLLAKVAVPGFSSTLAVVPSWQNELRYLDVVWMNMGWPFAAALIAPIAIFVASARWYRPRYCRMMGLVFGAMLGTAILYFILVASSKWLVMNLFAVRYFIPGYLLAMSIAGIALWHRRIWPTTAPAANSMAFLVMAAALFLGGMARLQTWHPGIEGVISDGKAPEAEAVAASYVARGLDAIAGDYWDVWPSVVAAEQYRYEARLDGTGVLGVTYRGEARRDAFMARLAAQGELRIGCIDLTLAACRDLVASTMKTSGLRAEEFAPKAQLPANHVLRFITVSLAAAASDMPS